jgi:hypothetical protein
MDLQSVALLVYVCRELPAQPMFAFQHEYAQLSDDELLQLASDRQSLSDNAQLALDGEMRNRNLTSVDFAKQKAFVKKNEQHETRRRNRKLFGHRRGLLAWVQFGLWALLWLSGTALVATWLAKR